MTILQNAYSAYLSKKYEKEINDFKELASKVIKNAETKLKDDLYLCTVLSNNKQGSDKASKNLLHLIEIERQIKNSPLEIDSRVFNTVHLDVLVSEHQKLNNLIVKGEKATIDEKKYKLDIPSNVEVNYDFEKDGISLKVANDKDIVDVAEKLINTYKKYVQERQKDHTKIVKDEIKRQQDSHCLAMKKLQFEMDHWKKYYHNKLKEIDGNVDLTKGTLNTGLITGITSNNIAEAIDKLTEIITSTIKKIETTEINLTVNDGNASASQFATEIMNSLKKNKGKRL